MEPYSQYNDYTENTIYISTCIGILGLDYSFADAVAAIAEGFTAYYSPVPVTGGFGARKTPQWRPCWAAGGI